MKVSVTRVCHQSTGMQNTTHIDIQSESMINASWKNQQVTRRNFNSDPFVFLAVLDKLIKIMVKFVVVKKFKLSTHSRTSKYPCPRNDK